MFKSTFLAEVLALGSTQSEFVQSSDHSTADSYAKALDQEGYIVLSVVPEDSYKMW